MHKRADSAAEPGDIILSQAKPTVKRANTLDKLRPRAWTKRATVAAPAPPSSPDGTVEVNIEVSHQFYDHDDRDDAPDLSTGTFHGLLNPRPRKKMFGNTGKGKPAPRPRPSARDSMESYTSSDTVVSSGESS